MSKIKKIFILIFVIFAMNMAFFNVCSNAGDDEKPSGYTYNLSEDWIDKSYGNVGEKTQNIMGTLINVMRIVGTGVAIIMITYVAIKYMSAAPEEKAEFKKSATAFIVGAVVLFASTNILSIIADFATKNT